MSSTDLYHDLQKMPAYRFAHLMMEERVTCAVGDDHFELDEQDDPRRAVIAAVAQERMAELLPVIKEIRTSPSPTFEEPSDNGAFGHTIQALIAVHTAEQHGIKPRGAGPDTAALRPLTDLGNAERFVGRYVGRVKYIIERGMWAVWDGTRWALDDTGIAELMMKETVRAIYEEILRTPTTAERAEIAKHASRSENNARIQAALRLAQTEPGIPAHLTDFDADPLAINCMNGLLDLRTSELWPHNPTQLVMNRVNVRYNPTAECPTWHTFLNRVLPDPAVRAFAQRFIGYALTGSTREQGFPILYGTGANGKTTLLELIGALLNDYAQSTTMDTFTAKRTDGGIPNDLARMAGARFISAVETNENVRLNEGLVKLLTGGDTITARFLHHEFFDFRPTHKIAISVNHRPIVRGTDHAIWRRIWLVPFSETIPEHEQDKDLRQKLLAELPGIFAWAVEGCRAWQEGGLNPPEKVEKATRAYRDEMDIVGTWLAECCVRLPHAEASAKALYASYVSWAEQSGERPRSQNEWGARLTEKGFMRERRRDGYHWTGIGLLSPDPGRDTGSVNLVNLREPYFAISAHESDMEKEVQRKVHEGSQGSHGDVSERLLTWANTVLGDTWPDAEPPAWVLEEARAGGIETHGASERVMAGAIVAAAEPPQRAAPSA